MSDPIIALLLTRASSKSLFFLQRPCTPRLKMLLFSVGVMVTAAGCCSKVSKTSENMYAVFLEKQSSIKREK